MSNITAVGAPEDMVKHNKTHCTDPVTDMSGMHMITVDEKEETPAHDQTDVNRDAELLLASANAIQRLVAERDALRSRVAILERDLTLLRQAQDSYRTVTTEFVTQFQVIDRAVSNLFGERSSTEANTAKRNTEAAAPASRDHAA